MGGTSPSTPVVQVADHAGACFGVERALSLVRAAMTDSDAPVRTLGSLIHNPVVVGELAASGVLAVASPAEAAGATLVLRAHGVTPEEESVARGVCASVVDATCPLVGAVHRAVEELSSGGYQVLVVGEARHPEVVATLAHAPDSVAIEGPADLDGVGLGRRVGVVVQTTQVRDRLREVVDAIVARGVVHDLRVVDTICDATTKRQQAAAELAARSDVMVVIGGRNSANTAHLAEICAERCEHTHHIETTSELEGGWFAGALAIGVTAGASTPPEHIDAVVSAVRNMGAADHG